ncbi:MULTISPECIES: SOS response-associated peptidase family protein [unclassified Mesorhizobium]|uniref:SOS response-associated peptidase family protein n=1 Tax=unclassified Mesorhizobium TaxID=325217 RepID=UPI001FE08445|nr:MULTISPECIES: SOS response-associated peptidase family protein [unclassified Mesorhizobium]
MLTCEPNATIAQIHNRMPIILQASDYVTWLAHPDPEHLMEPFPDELMTTWKIRRDVGNPRNNRPDLLDPVRDDLVDL